MAARDEIKRRFGEDYVPSSPRMYKNKAKNAQEAHECIRPTDMSAGPEKLKLADDQWKLYDLIWKRTIASQMAAAKMERTVVDIASKDGEVVLRANGQVVTFDGFLKVYDQGRDDDEGEDGARLPQLMQGEGTKKNAVTPEQHHHRRHRRHWLCPFRPFHPPPHPHGNHHLHPLLAHPHANRLRPDRSRL